MEQRRVYSKTCQSAPRETSLRWRRSTEELPWSSPMAPDPSPIGFPAMSSSSLLACAVSLVWAQKAEPSFAVTAHPFSLLVLPAMTADDESWLHLQFDAVHKPAQRSSPVAHLAWSRLAVAHPAFPPGSCPSSKATCRTPSTNPTPWSTPAGRAIPPSASAGIPASVWAGVRPERGRGRELPTSSGLSQGVYRRRVTEITHPDNSCQRIDGIEGARDIF